MLTGYVHPAYPASLSFEATPLTLPGSGGFLLRRAIPGTDLIDAIAPYPFLVCTDWSALPSDMSALPKDLVSITAVTDPFADFAEDVLAASFNTLVRPYKAHFVIDLARPLAEFADPHHLGCARRARRKLAIERCEEPRDHLDEWLRLYANLVARHDIRGPAQIAAQAFQRQLAVPGLTMFRAEWAGRAVGMILCIAQGDTAWFHFGAYDADGYRRNASYALVLAALEHFTQAGVRRMSIGAGSGAYAQGEDGLMRFKRGWASDTRMTFLCGQVPDPDAYARLAALTRDSDERYFPSYRAGEAA